MFPRTVQNLLRHILNHRVLQVTTGHTDQVLHIIVAQAMVVRPEVTALLLLQDQVVVIVVHHQEAVVEVTEVAAVAAVLAAAAHRIPAVPVVDPDHQVHRLPDHHHHHQVAEDKCLLKK